MQLQDRVRIFQERECPGVITSAFEAGRDVLKCAECGRIVGIIETGILTQLIELIPI